MKTVNIKSVSTESFVRFGFYTGLIFGILGVIIKIISPASDITAGIPFFSFSATRTFGSLFLWFVVAVLFSVLDLFLLAIIINFVLKLSEGVEINIKDGE